MTYPTDPPTKATSTASGKQKLWVSLVFSILVVAAQVLMAYGVWPTTADLWVTTIVTLLGTVGVYATPNKPYVNP